jgi:hypothetical protein
MDAAGTRVFELFQAGTHTAMNGTSFSFTPDDLRNMVAAYSKAKRPAPLCPGHPEDDQPALGYVHDLHTNSDATRLFAQAEVSGTLIGMVRKGDFNAVSAAFYGPDVAKNPTPGVYYLKHVGMLPPSMPPAVKNMSTLAFAAGTGLCFADEPVAAFSAPPGFTADPARLALHARALQHQRLCPGLSYVEAVRRADFTNRRA